MNLLSIDPGARGCGCALWRDGKLTAAKYVKNPADKGLGPSVARDMAHMVKAWVCDHVRTWDHRFVGAFELVLDKVILEWPQTYSGRAAKGDTNDLFTLAAVDGAIAALFPLAKVEHYVPHQWKGSVSKPDKVSQPYIIETRVRDRLSAEELACIDWPGNKKFCLDVTDAIGVGLHALGRFERKRAYARE